jgi:antitoxin MazE
MNAMTHLGKLMTTQSLDIETSVNQWGNGLAVRINKAIAGVAGVAEGTPVRVHAEYGRILIEALHRPLTLEEMLAHYDPQRHGGEVLAPPPIGKEVL